MSAQIASVYQLEQKRAEYMGKPQTEDGYLRIANELFDEILKRDFSLRQLKVILAVMRKTYGYNKKADEIGLSQIRDLTGISRSHLSPTINQLCSMRILVVTEGFHARTISINKHYKEWVLPNMEQLPKEELLPDATKSVTESVHRVLPNREPQKTVLKDSKQKTVIGDDSPKKPSSFPARFEISETNLKLAGELNVSAESEAGKFEDYHRAKGSKFSDWNRAFNNWLRKASEFKQQKTEVKTIGGMKVGKNWC